MTHQDAFAPPASLSPPTLAEATLDRALDAYVRGDSRALDRLGRDDPELRASVAEIYELADQSGFVVEAPLPARRDAIRPDQTTRHTRPRRRRMSTFATVAATIAAVVGIAFAIPAFSPDREGDAPTQLAFEAPTALDGSSQPAASGDDVAAVQPGSGPVTPLSPDECSVEPRPREEVLALLSVAPADGANVARPDSPLDDGTVDDLRVVLREWQACTVFGKTWEAMSLETAQYIREDIYGGGGILRPYSEATLGEILDGRELVDAARAEAMSDPAVVADEPVAVVDEEGENAVTSRGSARTAWVEVRLVSPSTGETVDGGTVIFVLEEGQWRIRSIDRDVSHAASGARPAAATAGPVVELSAPGISWSTYALTVPVGGVINLFNDGSGGQHTFVIEGYNDTAPVHMPVGETVVWTVPADLAPGTYTYYCAIPGHRALMEGTITITET